MDPIAEGFPTPIFTLSVTPSATPAQIIEKRIVEHFSNTESSTMAAPSVVATQEPEVITQIKYVNPFADITDAMYEYSEPVLAKVKDWKAHAVKKFQQNIPIWIQDWLSGITNFVLKSSALFIAFVLLGVIAFETSFNIFRAMGLMPRHHFILIKKEPWQRELELETMTYDEKKRFEVLCEQNAKLHEAVSAGGHWLWGSSTTVLLGYVFFTDEMNFWIALFRAFVICLGIFTVLPYVCAWIVRFVVPEAMLCVPWLGREEDAVPTSPVVEETQKVKFQDPIAPRETASRNAAPRERQGYRFALDDDEQVASVREYLNESKRVGYGKRAAKASSRGGLP